MRVRQRGARLAADSCSSVSSDALRLIAVKPTTRVKPNRRIDQIYFLHTYGVVVGVAECGVVGVDLMVLKALR